MIVETLLSVFWCDLLSKVPFQGGRCRVKSVCVCADDYLRMCFKAFSLFKYLMFSLIAD